METLTSKAELKKEIRMIQTEIESIETTLKDYRLMATGEFNRQDLIDEKHALIKERNILLAQI